MPPDLHVDPAALRAAAASAGPLPAALHVVALDPADLDALGGVRGGAVLVAEHDRLVAAAARAARELGELAAALDAAATAVENAEAHAVESLTARER